MTKPVFEGREIEVGDEVTVRMLVRGFEPSGEIGLVDLDDTAIDAYWVPISHIASHTPAPKPLVPGPAVKVCAHGDVKVWVLAIDQGEVWVRYVDDGTTGVERVAHLRNIPQEPK